MIIVNAVLALGLTSSAHAAHAAIPALVVGFASDAHASRAAVASLEGGVPAKPRARAQAENPSPRRAEGRKDARPRSGMAYAAAVLAGAAFAAAAFLGF